MAAHTFEDGTIVSEIVIDIELQRKSGRVTREEAFDLARVANEIRKERDQLAKQVADLESKRKYYQDAERELSDAYIRIRMLIDAFDTPYAPTAKQVWDHTESKIKTLLSNQK